MYHRYHFKNDSIILWLARTLMYLRACLRYADCATSPFGESVKQLFSEFCKLHSKLSKFPQKWEIWDMPTILSRASLLSWGKHGSPFAPSPGGQATRERKRGDKFHLHRPTPGSRLPPPSPTTPPSCSFCRIVPGNKGSRPSV